MKIIGITGGIGTGKSYCAKLFAAKGIPVYDTDCRAKNIMTGNKTVINAMIKLLGSNTYLPNGELNRTYVASQLFSDKSIKQKIEAIVHPAVYHDFKGWCSLQNAPYVLKESALLFETGSAKDMDAVITVYASLDTRLKRIIQRDKTTREQALARVNNQMEMYDKIQLTNFILYNEENFSLENQINKIHDLILQK